MPGGPAKGGPAKGGSAKGAASASAAGALPPWAYKADGWANFHAAIDPTAAAAARAAKAADGDDGDMGGMTVFQEFHTWVENKLRTHPRRQDGSAVTPAEAIAMTLQKVMTEQLQRLAAKEGNATFNDTNTARTAAAAKAGKPAPAPVTWATRLEYFENDKFLNGFIGAGRDLLGAGITSRQQLRDPRESGYTKYIQQVFNTQVGDIRHYFEGHGVGKASSQCRNALPNVLQEWYTATAATKNTDLECYICGKPMFQPKPPRTWCNTADAAKGRGQDTFPVMECEHILPMITAVAHWSLWHNVAHQNDKELMKHEYAYAHQCCNQIKSDIDPISFNKGCFRTGNTYIPNRRGIQQILKNIAEKPSYDCPSSQNDGGKPDCPQPPQRGWPKKEFKYDNSAFQIDDQADWLQLRTDAIVDRLRVLLRTINANVAELGAEETYLLFARCKIIFAISTTGRHSIDDLLRGVLLRRRLPPLPPAARRRQVVAAAAAAAQAAVVAFQAAPRRRILPTVPTPRKRRNLPLKPGLAGTGVKAPKATIITQGTIGKRKVRKGAVVGGGKGNATDYDSSDFDDDESESELFREASTDPTHEWTVDQKLDDVSTDFLLGWILNQRTENEFKERLYESFSDLLVYADEAVAKSDQAGESRLAAEGAGEAVAKSEHATSDIMETPFPLSSSKRTQAALPENIEATTAVKFSPTTSETFAVESTRGGSRRLVLGKAKLNRTIGKASRVAQKRVGRGDLLRGRIFSEVKRKRTKKRKGKKILTRKKNTRKKRKTIRKKKNKRGTNKRK